MPAFHLFHLPLVAMEHVLCMMSPFELINVSKTFSKAKRAVTNFLRIKPKFRIRVGVATELIISITDGNKDWSYFHTPDHFKNGRQEHFDIVFHRIYQYSQNPIKEWMKAYEYIKGVLGCSFEDIDFEMHSFPEKNREIINWLSSESESAKSIRVESWTQKCDDDLKYLLSRLKASRELSLMVNYYEDNFQIEIPESYKLYILNSKFINYEQFMRLKHSEISLHRSILTFRQINGFLKSWMACETHLDLKFLKISSSGVSSMNILMSIPHENTTDPDIIKKLQNHPFEMSASKAFIIKRTDGKTATFGVLDLRVGWRLCLFID